MLAKSPVMHGAVQSSRWVLALTILLGQVTLAFSMFAVAVALPSIMNALSADVTTIHWVMTGFQIARTVPMPAMGWLSSLVGPRNLYIAGLLLTVISTVCCGLAWNLESLICFRVLQGLGAAPRKSRAWSCSTRRFPPGSGASCSACCFWRDRSVPPSAPPWVAIWCRNIAGVRCFICPYPPPWSASF